MTFRRPAVLNLVFVFAFTAAAQQRQAPAHIEGVVVKAGTDERVQGGTVQLKQPPGQPGPSAIITTHDGRFDADIQPGRFDVSVWGNGFYFPRKKLTPTLSIAAGDRKQLRLEVLPALSFSGRVTDINGRPMPSVRVEVLENAYTDGVHGLNSVGSAAMTNAQGQYRIENIPPGRYGLRATPIAAATLPRAERLALESFAAVYQPDGVSAEDARLVLFESGQEIRDINFRLRPGSAFSATVKLVLPSMPIHHVSLYAVRRGRHGIFGVSGDQAESLGTDVYRIPRLSPGTYDVLAIVNGSFLDPQPWVARFSVTVTSSDVDAGTAVARSGASVSGRVITLDQASQRFDARGIRVTLRPIDNAPPSFYRTSPPLDNNGVFKIAGVIDGRFQVNVSGLPVGYYVQSAFYKGQNVLDGGISINGDSLDSLEVFVANGVGTVQGTTSSPSSLVVLVPSSSQKWLNHDNFKSSFSDDKGDFSIGGIAPGDYLALAWDDMPLGAFTDPEFLEAHQRQAVRVTVEPGSQGSVSLRSLSE